MLYSVITSECLKIDLISNMDQRKVLPKKEFVLSKGEALCNTYFFSQVSLACDARDIVRWEHFWNFY